MSSHQDDNDSDGSSAERAAKRLRSSTDIGDDGGLALMPPEVWAGVMEYLSFDTILSCAATSRSLLHDAMPLLTKLHIDKASQINLTVGSRFRDIKEIHINSLLSLRIEDAGTPEQFKDIEVDLETKIRVVPFLSRFYKLEQVHFGGKTESGENAENFAPAADYFFEGDDPYPDEGPRESMLAFLDHVCGAFRCGALPKHLKISGLCCPELNNGRSHRNGCETCLRACKSFPLESVVCFECRGSSVSNARSGRMYGLDVCLERAHVESIIESRPGGRELLRSDERLLRLLGSGRRYKIASDNGNMLYIVKYEEKELDEIKRVITYAELDLKKLSIQKVSEAIMRSFAIDENDAMPPKSQRYLAAESLDFLQGKIGLTIDNEDFESPLKDLVKHAQHFAWVLSQVHAVEEDEDTDRHNQYVDIGIDCLRLIRQFLEIEDNPPIQAIVSAIPCLAHWLDTDEYKMETASSLRNILAKGTAVHRKMIIEAGAIPSFSCMLNSSNDSLVKMAVLSLSDIVTGGTKEHIKEMVMAGAISDLINLLDSKDKVCVETSLKVLAVAAKDHITASEYTLLLNHLVPMIESSDKTDLLAGCSMLLRTILEADNPPIQRVIDSAIVPRLVQLIKTTDDHIILTNLAHVMTSLADGSNEQTAALVEETFSFLVGLQDSSCDAIGEKVISTLHDIASGHSTGTWVSWKKQPTLCWGEFYVKGELVDSDDESDVSFEEAEETDDARVKLEVMQAVAGNNRVKNDETDINFDQLDDVANESAILMGMPNILLEKIFHFARVSEVALLEGVCKRFRGVVTSDDFWARLYPGTRVNTRKLAREWYGTWQIRWSQKYSDVESNILSVLGDETDRAEVFRTMCSDLLSRMIQTNAGPAVHFRLRGDTISYLAELAHGYMVERLAQALLAAVHGHRTKVQEEDVLFVFRNGFHSFPSCSSSQELASTCDVQQNGALSTLDCSRSFPFASGIVWRWPEDDDCHDVLPPEAGRRIIRILAYRAGIKEMSNDAFLLAEAQMLHSMGVLLVDAYESSVEMAKSASYLEVDGTLVYRKPMNSGLPLLLHSDTDDSSTDGADGEPTDAKTCDMFKVPPPPFNSPPDISTENDLAIETIYTIVPGQIAAAAERRNITPYNVYGDGWVVSSGFTHEEEQKIEESYYYKPYYEEYPDADSDSSDGESNEESTTSDRAIAGDNANA